MRMGGAAAWLVASWGCGDWDKVNLGKSASRTIDHAVPSGADSSATECPRLVGDPDLLPTSCDTIGWSNISGYALSTSPKAMQFSRLSASVPGQISSVQYTPLPPVGTWGDSASPPHPQELPRIIYPVPGEVLPASIALDLPGYDGRLALSCWLENSPPPGTSPGGLHLFWPNINATPPIHAEWTVDQSGTASLSLPAADRKSVV